MAILGMVITFLAGFISGATVAILRGKPGAERPVAERPATVQPQETETAPEPQKPSPLEVASKVQTLKEILKKDPKNLPALAELGNLYFDSDQPKDAIEAYIQYLAIKPDNADVRTDLGIMYRKLGNFDRAMEEFRKAAKSDPKHVNSRYNIGIVLLHDKGDIQGAIRAWEEYLKVDPKSERAQRVMAQMENLKKMAK